MTDREIYLRYVNEHFRKFKEKKMNESEEGYKKMVTESQKKWRKKVKETSPEGYKRLLYISRFSYWKRLHNTLPNDQFLNKFINLENRDEEFAKALKEHLKLTNTTTENA